MGAGRFVRKKPTLYDERNACETLLLTTQKVSIYKGTGQFRCSLNGSISNDSQIDFRYPIQCTIPETLILTAGLASFS